MWRILKIGSAFIGIIVGAGFASGQEILQYFTSFGYLGIIAAFISTVLFAYLGMNLTLLGSRVQTNSHREVVYKISGRYLGLIVDGVLIFTLFGSGVVMVAGAGSILNQQFGLSPIIGTGLLTIILIITIMLDVDRVIDVIGGLTPLLVIAVVLVGIYIFFTMDNSLATLNPIAKAHPSALSNWFLSAINYVSFNIALGASMALVMGGTEKDERTAALGGLVGGIGLGLLIFINHFIIFAKIDQVAHADMPMLQVFTNISPTLGVIYSIILALTIYAAAVSMFYAFVARFATMKTKKANILTVITCVGGFIASFAGFTKLVGWFYPLIGYLGLFLIVALIIGPFRIPPKKSKKTIPPEKAISLASLKIK